MGFYLFLSDFARLGAEWPKEEPRDLGAKGGARDRVEQKVARERGVENGLGDLVGERLPHCQVRVAIAVDTHANEDVVQVNGQVEHEEHERDEYDHFGDATRHRVGLGSADAEACAARRGRHTAAVAHVRGRPALSAALQALACLVDGAVARTSCMLGARVQQLRCPERMETVHGLRSGHGRRGRHAHLLYTVRLFQIVVQGYASAALVFHAVLALVVYVAVVVSFLSSGDEL